MNERGVIANRLFEMDRDWDADDDWQESPDVKTAADEMRAKLRTLAVPFERIGWDYYDMSLEIYGVDPAYRMPPEVQQAIRDEGFITVYVNHADKWETHYNWRGDTEFVASNGWRVSYPHKRGDGGAIWTEESVSSWPAAWFKTGYVIVKRWLKP